MNKKLFLGAAALTATVVGGFVYYRWVRTLDKGLYPRDEAPFGIRLNPLLPENGANEWIDVDERVLRDAGGVEGRTRYLTEEEQARVEHILEENDRLERDNVA